MTAERPTRVRWVVLALACAASWILYLHRYAWGVIKFDVKNEFGLSDTQLGSLDSVFNFAYAACQIPTGLLGDLFGPALVLPAIILAWSLVVALTTLGGGLGSFATIRTVFGVTQAGAYPNLGKVTGSWFPVSVRTTVQGAVASLSGRAGGACAALVVGTLLMGWLELGWRAALLWIALGGIVLAVLFGIFFRDRPALHPRVNEAERRLIEGEAVNGRTETGETRPAERRLRLERHPMVYLSFAALMLQTFISAFVDQLFVYWTPLFLEEEKGLDKIAMGVFASLPLFAGAVGGFVGGFLNDYVARFTSRRVARSAVGFTGKLLSAVLIAVAIGVDDGRQMMVVLAMAKFFTDWSQPTVWGTVTDIGGRAAGSVFGTVNMVGSLGATAAGPVIGAIKQHHGWTPLFWTLAGLYVGCALTWLAIDCTRKLFREEGRTEEHGD